MLFSFFLLQRLILVELLFLDYLNLWFVLFLPYNLYLHCLCLQKVVGIQESSSAAESSSTAESSEEEKRSLQKGKMTSSFSFSALSVFTKLALNYITMICLRPICALLWDKL